MASAMMLRNEAGNSSGVNTGERGIRLRLICGRVAGACPGTRRGSRSSFSSTEWQNVNLAESGPQRYGYRKSRLCGG